MDWVLEAGGSSCVPGLQSTVGGLRGAAHDPGPGGSGGGPGDQDRPAVTSPGAGDAPGRKARGSGLGMAKINTLPSFAGRLANRTGLAKN